MAYEIKRRKTRQVSVGDIKIGGDAPITVQSMLNAKTTDVKACLKQIDELKSVGCDLIRLAITDEHSCDCFKEIAEISGLPLIADVHYSYALALKAAKSGAKKLRINPGNMPDVQNIKPLAEYLIDNGIPVRVGVNGGSLDKKFEGLEPAEALKESALSCANVFEAENVRDIVIAIKHSDPLINIDANERLAKSCDYPLHIGVTESGTLRSGLVKSSIGIGTLLKEGIGDTIRVSLSADVKEEVLAAKTILKTLGIRHDGVNVVSCPTCARTQIDVNALAEKIESLTANVKTPLTISVLGCPLNGIGEGEHSDIGIAGGREKSVLMCDGKIVKTVENQNLIKEFMILLDNKLKSIL